MVDNGSKMNWRRVQRSTLLLAVVVSGLLWASVAGLKHVWAERARAAAVTTLEVTALPAAVRGQGATQWKAVRPDSPAGVVIAGYEGTFDPRTKRMVIQTPREPQEVDARNANIRVDPNSEVLRTSQFSFNVVNSTFLSSGDLAGNISGEIQLMNKTNVTFYNTRLVFTRFKVCPATGTCDGTTATQDATATPGQTGFSYYNDGLIPFGGRLNVSRAYGNIPAGGTSNAVWSFNVSTTPARFFFSFSVLADLGVAAESVYPAAVQVNTNNGASVTVRGSNFSGSPTVTLLDASGNLVATLSNVAVTSENLLTGTVPPGTPAGIYSVRVTLSGGTPGGINSSTILQRLTVTGVPTASLSGAVTAINGTGPFLVTSDLTLNAGVTVAPGAVFYMSNGARVILGSAGNLTANGGVPGVPNGANVLNPAQIVFTAQRSPGAQLPTQGSWGGIDATAVSSAVLSLRNVVIEYGGQNAKANLDLSGSGRTLRFSDSLTRHSAGPGLALTGANETLTGFTRNRIEYNGQASGTPAMLVSANVALGLYDIPATTGQDAVPLNTFITDPIYLYSGANVFMGNQVDAVQIDAAANDFTRSGVLVGQGTTPIQLRGGTANPAIVGTTPPAAPAEVTITPTTLIQLDAGMDFQAGDYETNRVGCIAANGFAGVNQVPGASSASGKFIVFDERVPGSNFGAIFFARTATSSCLLNFVEVRNGGASSQGAGAVIADGTNLPVRNTRVTESSSGGILELNGAVINSSGSTSAGNANLVIDTIAGGLYGDGNVSTKATLVTPQVIAVDPQGRGVYFVDVVSNTPALLRFLNTTRNTVTLAGIKIAGGTIRAIAGGGLDLNDGAKALQADLGTVTGLAVSPGTGDLVYFIDRGGQYVRFVNVSGSPVTVNGSTVNPGRVGTFSLKPENNDTYGASLNGLATRANGEVLLIDATTGVNRVYKIPATGGAGAIVAGNGSTSTRASDAFSAGIATSVPLLAARALATDANNNIYIADTGHGRVIKVDQAGQATLVAQYTPDFRNPIGEYQRPPFPSGVAVFQNKVYIALGNAHQVRVVDGASDTVLTGTKEVSCDFSSSNCGDGGPASAAQLNLIGSSTDVPLASLAADANGLFISDQGSVGQGRLRYINLKTTAVEVAGISLSANIINTVAGAGFKNPYDGGLATGGELRSPGGVAVDPANGNLWIADTLASKIRYVNRTNSTVTLFSALPADQQLVVPPGTIATVNRDVGKLEGIGTDDVPSVQAGFDTPQGLHITSIGVFVVDTKKGPSQPCSTQNSICRRTSLIRFINTSNSEVTFYPNGTPILVPAGYTKTIAGGGTDSNRDVNDGTDPLNAKFTGATDITVASNGDLYVADAGSGTVRKITRTTGVVARMQLPGFNALALTQPQTTQYTSVLFDSTGRLLTLDTLTNRLYREKTPGSGLTANGFDTLLTGNPLNEPRDMVFDAAGSLYVTNAGDHKILKLTISSNTATGVAIAGTTQGYSGDLGAANTAQMDFSASPILVSTGLSNQAPVRPQIAITLGLSNELIFTDTKNNAIRRIR